ncbi:MAG: hypothetical protein K0S34_1908 [Bacillales bacterium]|jgi:hypothetical protein|nr:hypothetical protein [Bacillales bacterium]
MSLRAIELQVALPRSQDVGKLQESMQQRGNHVSENLQSSILKEDERLRHQVNDLNQKNKAKLNSDQGNSKNNQNNSNQKKQHDNKIQEEIKHPYKGTNIDFSG